MFQMKNGMTSFLYLPQMVFAVERRESEEKSLKKKPAAMKKMAIWNIWLNRAKDTPAWQATISMMAIALTMSISSTRRLLPPVTSCMDRSFLPGKAPPSPGSDVSGGCFTHALWLPCRMPQLRNEHSCVRSFPDSAFR